MDRTKVSIEAKQRAEDDIRRDVEIAKLGAENALVERVRWSVLPCTCDLLSVRFPLCLTQFIFFYMHAIEDQVPA